MAGRNNPENNPGREDIMAIINTAAATYTLTNLMGTYHFSNPRKASLDASIILSSRFVRHEVVEERRGRSYLVVDDRGCGVRYIK